MNRFLIYKLLIVLSICFFTQCSDSNKSTGEITILSPEELYGKLFFDVQSSQTIFKDSKTFVDCIPKYDVSFILDQYQKLNVKSDETILNFVKENFLIPKDKSAYKPDSASIGEHISKLWETLKRPSDIRKSGTLIPLPYPYVVPSGEVREMYYWDSYFTMLGLQKEGDIEMVQNMVDNFSHLINTFGFVPSGNRMYYVSRSQPPFYSLMIALLAESKGEEVYAKYLPVLETEYAFWMDGEDKLSNTDSAFRHVVRMPDGEVLNRYWDDLRTPRPDNYFEDIEIAHDATFKEPKRTHEDMYQNLRAAAESGWGFSSRWLSTDPKDKFGLYTLHTTHILPVDLNCLLYYLEYSIERAYRLVQDEAKAEIFKAKATARKRAIVKYHWSQDKGFFMDYDFTQKTQTEVYSLAGVFPLFFKITDQEQADLVTKKLEASFLKAGGLVATLNNTGQQWDAPNGWAPLQWISIKGLKNYGQDSLANDIKKRWLTLNEHVYNDSYRMLDKYNVVDISQAGGYFQRQDGFGWTNGVYQMLVKE